MLIFCVYFKAKLKYSLPDSCSRRRVLEAEAPFGWGLLFRASLKGRLVRFSPKEAVYVVAVLCLFVYMCPVTLEKR